MRKHASALLSAAIAAGTIAFCGSVVAQNDTSKTNPPGAGAGASGSVDRSGVHVSGGVNPPGTDATAQPLALPPGFSQKDLNETKDIKSTVASATEKAVDKGSFDGLVGYLAKPDEDRIDPAIKNLDTAKLDGRIDQFRRDWKAKYNADFDIDKEQVVFNEQFKIVTGEVADEATAMANWPVPATTDVMGAARTAGEQITGNANRTKQTGDVGEGNQGNKAAEAKKLDKGRNVAVMRFPASHGLPTLNVSLLHQLPDNWRIDIPDDRTADQVYNDLLTHLTYIDDHKDQWPADVNDGYRMVSHHVQCALYGVPMKEQAMGAGGSGASAR